MCFSLEADLIVGGLVMAMGVDALVQARSPADRLLATVPVVLGTHLLVEVAVWATLEHGAPAWVGRTGSWAYLFVAFVVVPILVPVAVLGVMPARRRRILPLVVLGVIVAGVLLSALLEGPVIAVAEANQIAYSTGLTYGGWVIGAYVVATCGSLILSGDDGLRWFGVANGAAVAVLVWIESTALISLWCAWAAITSVAIELRIRRGGEAPHPGTVTVEHRT